MMNMQQYYTLCVSTVLWSSEAFKIGVLVETDWINLDLSVYDSTTTGLASVEFTTHAITGNNVMETTNTVCDLLGQGYGGFISFVGCPNAHVIDMQSKSRLIPHIMLVKKPCYLGQTTDTYQLSPPCTEVNKAVTDIVSSIRWLEVFIIHDENLESRCLQDAVAGFSRMAIRSRILNTSGYSINQIVTTIKGHNPSVIVVFVNDRSLKSILREAKDHDLFTSTKAWVVITQDILLPRMFNVTAKESRVLFLRGYYDKLEQNDKICTTKWPTELDNSSLIEDLLSDAKSVYQKVLDNLVTASPSYTFQSLNCRDEIHLPGGKKLMTGIEKVKLNLLTGTCGWNAEKYPIESQFQICSTRSDFETFHHMGRWTSGKGLHLDDGVLFGNEFTTFGGKKLTIATLPAEPFVYVTEVNGVKTYRGFCFDIVNEMAKRFNFSYEIVQPADGQYGGPKDDGTWSGMVGMVKRGEIDFAIGPFTITSVRETVIDFTVPYMEDGVGILTKKITEEPYKIFKTLKPFSLRVWGAIGIVIIVVGFLLFVVNRLSPYTVDGQDAQVDTADEQKKLKENFWLIYGSFLEQAVDPRPSSNSGRVMLGCWWVFTILMMSTYTANLAAYLTVSITVQPINSLAELVAQDEIKPLVKAGTNLPILFKNANSGIYRKVWEKMSDMPYVTSRSEAVELTRKGKYAFMTDLSQLEFVQLQDCETLALADEVFNQAGVGFVVPENAPFKEGFNLNIMKMQEAGMTERWRDKWWPKINTCSYASRTGGAKPLDMDSIAGLFYVYVGVVGLSITMFVLNLFCQMCIKRYSMYITPMKNQLLRKISIQRKTSKNANSNYTQR